MTLIATTVSFLGGCGAGSVTPTTTPDPTTVTTTTATVQLLVNNSQIPSSGTTTVDVTAVVLSSTGQVIADKAVIFSKGADASAYFSDNSSITNANGIATAKLNLGNNKSNRAISITATADSISSLPTDVNVTGTNIAISGNNSLALGASTTLTLSVKDSAGIAMPGTVISVTSANGNSVTLTPSTGVADASGQITATITATNPAATDVITATAAGVSKTQNLTISSSAFNLTAPTLAQLIPINTATPISLTWSNASGVVAASAVNFTASRGTITGAAATTNGSGVATASITSNTTGTAIIAAASPSGTPATSVDVVFYTNTASSIAAQATPGTIQVTTGTAGQSNNSTVISVVVRDATNNLVNHAQVNFSITTDASGGSLSSSTATTDNFGSASVNYIAGGASSPQNGVTISATVVSINGVAITPVSGTVSLTVAGQALQVRLGTDNVVISSPPINQKKYVAIVTDSAGVASVGVNVTFKLRPAGFYKGYYYINTVDKVWHQIITDTCLNEDNGNVVNTVVNGVLVNNANHNGALYAYLNGITPGSGADATKAFNGQVDFQNIDIDPTAGVNIQNGEDYNKNGSLEPGGVATITDSGVTDANGVATATITYPKGHSSWAKYTVEARAGLNSNDPPATASIVLPGAAPDYQDIKISPPGQTSPFGIGDFTGTATDILTGMVTVTGSTASCHNSH